MRWQYLTVPQGGLYEASWHVLYVLEEQNCVQKLHHMVGILSGNLKEYCVAVPSGSTDRQWWYDSAVVARGCVLTPADLSATSAGVNLIVSMLPVYILVVHSVVKVSTPPRVSIMRLYFGDSQRTLGLVALKYQTYDSSSISSI